MSPVGEDLLNHARRRVPALMKQTEASADAVQGAVPPASWPLSVGAAADPAAAGSSPQRLPLGGRRLLTT